MAALAIPNRATIVTNCGRDEKMIDIIIAKDYNSVSPYDFSEHCCLICWLVALGQIQLN